MTSNKIYISVDKKVLILPNKWISPVVVYVIESIIYNVQPVHKETKGMNLY